MSRRLLDTSVLISGWKKYCVRNITDYSPSDAKSWGRKTIELYNSSAIVTPVYVEFIVGVRSSDELHLAKSFLNEFTVIDNSNITPDDWKLAINMAERVPHDGKPRQFGDCLIRAIATCRNYDPFSLDARFSR